MKLNDVAFILRSVYMIIYDGYMIKGKDTFNIMFYFKSYCWEKELVKHVS